MTRPADGRVSLILAPTYMIELSLMSAADTQPEHLKKRGPLHQSTARSMARKISVMASGVADEVSHWSVRCPSCGSVASLAV